MNLKDTIKHDIINYFISEMNKDILKKNKNQRELQTNKNKDMPKLTEKTIKELVEQSAQFVQNVARMKKLERILIDEFKDDFEFETERETK